MAEKKEIRRNRIGLVLLAPAALTLAISCVGCGTSAPRPEAGLKASSPSSITVTLINNCAAPDNVINVR